MFFAFQPPGFTALVNRGLNDPFYIYRQPFLLAKFFIKSTRVSTA
jgi:hypothetical protein